MTKEMLRGFYRSTFFPDARSAREFAADAIISNPPAFAHLHVAEALGLPLHMSFSECGGRSEAGKEGGRCAGEGRPGEGDLEMGVCQDSSGRRDLKWDDCEGGACGSGRSKCTGMTGVGGDKREAG